MLYILAQVCKLAMRGLTLGARIALSRVTIIITFVAGMAATITTVFESLTDVDGLLGDAVESIQSASVTISDFVSGNEYLQLVGYGLSLDTLCDGIVSTFFWIVCTLGGFLLAATLAVFVSVAPLLADLAVSGIKRQFANQFQVFDS